MIRLPRRGKGPAVLIGLALLWALRLWLRGPVSFPVQEEVPVAQKEVVKDARVKVQAVAPPAALAPRAAGQLALFGGSDEADTDAVLAAPTRESLLVVYVYYQTPDAYRNFKFFLRHGLHREADFIFVIQGDDLSAKIPDWPNIKVIRGPNECFDLGRWGETVRDGRMSMYDKYILMNASVRGPFFPAYSNECWSDVFTRRVTDKNKLVGTVLDCDSSIEPYVESMILATDQVGLALIQPSLQCWKDFFEGAVVQGERGISYRILEAGFTVDALMTVAHSHPSGETSEFMKDRSLGRCNFPDVNRPKAMFGLDPNPFDMIFIKCNRHINDREVEYYTQWTKDRAYSSADKCRVTGKTRALLFGEAEGAGT